MRIIFAGTGEIGLPTLRWLAGNTNLVAVVTQPDKPVGRSQTLTPPTIKVEALSRSLPVLQPSKIRTPEAISELASFDPDLMIVMAYGQLLPKAVLDLPKVACLNLHASLLPKHRGAAPIQACIMSGDTFSGVTVMYMAEGLDTGDILLKRETKIRRRETGGSLHDRLGFVAAQAIQEALPLLEAGLAPRIPQDDSLASYAKKLTREDGQIQWTNGAVAVERTIRAMNPWPGAYSGLRDRTGVVRKLKLHSAIRFRRVVGAPGLVVRSDNRGILIGTGDGSILVTELQLEGKKRLRVSEFLRGHPVEVGSHLSSLPD